MVETDRVILVMKEINLSTELFPEIMLVGLIITLFSNMPSNSLWDLDNLVIQSYENNLSTGL